MAHYAKVENDLVTQVIVAEAEFFDTFVDSSPGEWVQTSYNGNFRNNFAGIGYTYDKTNDRFIPPKPYPSYTLDGSTNIWEPPVAYPDDSRVYSWNEDTTNWTEIT